MSSSQWPAGGSSLPTTYDQSPAPILVSGSITVPKGTKLIHALMCGGGGGGLGGGNTAQIDCAGGFGGLAIMEIPLVMPGSILDYVVGAGGLGAGYPTLGMRGGATSVYHNSTLLASIGGGGGGAGGFVNNAGPGGGGGGRGGRGGLSPIGRMIWSCYPQDRLKDGDFCSGAVVVGNTTDMPHYPGGGGIGGTINQTNFAQYQVGYGGGADSGYNVNPPAALTYGGGGGAPAYVTQISGGMDSVTVWGLTGFAGVPGGPSTSNIGGGGGSGMLGPGTTPVADASPTGGRGGNGGLGGGGGGAGAYRGPGSGGFGGNGGNGFIMFRFYR